MLLIIIFILILFILWYNPLSIQSFTRLYDPICFQTKIYHYNNNNSFTLALIGGVHGNEPAGAAALSSLVSSGYFERLTQALNIHIIVIPNANPCGGLDNSRYHPDLFYPDINRVMGRLQKIF